MSINSAIVIVTPGHLAAVKDRLAGAQFVAVIGEPELLQVQDSFLSRPPDILVMHSAFATTSRGATLIAKLKEKGVANDTAIRVFIEDDVKAPLILSEMGLAPHDALLETSRPLERSGTRQAARYAMARRAVAVNGDAGELIDLSISGAQVVSAMRLRPLKLARLVIPDEAGDLRLQGTVAWAIAVPGPKGIHYRAGVEFVKPDQEQLAAFCERHGTAPDTSGKK